VDTTNSRMLCRLPWSPILVVFSYSFEPLLQF
jgi:hypothetical protein